MAKADAATTDTTKVISEKVAAKKNAAAEPKMMYVIDTTATPEGGPRVHHLMVDGLVKPFAFKHAEAVRLPPALAHKLLKFESFVQVDENGNRIEYKRTPKQPDDLGAGETLSLAKNETVARYDELTTTALHQRVTAMIGGEKFAHKPETTPIAKFRADMIDFIIKKKEALAAANRSREAAKADEELEEFTPEAADDGDFDDDIAA